MQEEGISGRNPPFQDRGAGGARLAGLVKAKARSLGFDLCGVARARPLDPARFDRWIEQGWDGPAIGYVRERRAERLDPSLLVPGARSVVMVAASYAPDLPEAPASCASRATPRAAITTTSS